MASAPGETRGGGKRILAVLGYETLFGAERANVQVLKLLREQGLMVECIVRDNGAASFRAYLDAEGFHTHPATFGPSLFGIQRNPWHYLRNLKGMVGVFRAIRKAGRSFNPTHVYVPNYIQFVYALFGIWWLRKPVVFRVGDPPETTRLHRLLWSRIIAPNVAEFVTNSEFTRGRLLRACGVRCNARVIQNCGTRRNLLVAWPDLDARVQPVITYLGQFNESKGVHFAVDAAIATCRRYPDVTFQFVGMRPRPDDYTARLVAKVAEVRLEQRIAFLEFRDDVAAVLARSSLHLCPSLQEESSANVVVEAKMAGVPSIVFRRGGLPELIRHKVDGFIAATPDEAGLVDGIEFFLQDSEMLRCASLAAWRSSRDYLPNTVGPLWTGLFRTEAGV